MGQVPLGLVPTANCRGAAESFPIHTPQAVVKTLPLRVAATARCYWSPCAIRSWGITEPDTIRTGFDCDTFNAAADRARARQLQGPRGLAEPSL